MYGCRLLCILFHTFADRDFFPMFLCIIEPGLCKKEIDKSGVAAVHHKVNIPVLAEAVRVLIDRNGFRPGFIITGNTPIPIFLPDRVGKNITHPVIAELFQNLMYCLRAEVVIPVVIGNGLFDCLLTGDICLIGSAVLFRLSMLTRIGSRIDI